MRISDWSSDVCSSDLQTLDRIPGYVNRIVPNNCVSHFRWQSDLGLIERHSEQVHSVALRNQYGTGLKPCSRDNRSEEHTSELQSLMRISYAVFCLKKKKKTQPNNTVDKHLSRKQRETKKTYHTP